MKALFTSIALLTFPAGVALADEPVVQEAPMGETITVKVNGMVCDFCARSVTKVFSKQDAVATVDVDLDSSVVRIGLKAGQSLDTALVEDLIRKSGYSPVSVDNPTT